MTYSSEQVHAVIAFNETFRRLLPNNNVRYIWSTWVEVDTYTLKRM